MKSKEALSKIKNILREDEFSWDYIEELEKIEEDLNVLEILKNKKVNVMVLDHLNNVKQYNEWRVNDRSLTEEEFKKLKEWVNG